MISIAYFTSRIDPHIDWFCDSLAKQLNGDEVQLIVVDFHAGKRPLNFGTNLKINVEVTAPKPCIWQGDHRITKEDWFAAGNARNTAICLAKGSHIACVDDLSVLLPGWLDSVRQSVRENYIALGAYKKMKNLVVENGEVKSFNIHSADNRLSITSTDRSSCGGGWFYGCSFCMPVEAALEVNGFPEDLCGGLGFEDVCFGLTLGNTNKFSFQYDRRMMTYESEEAHFVDKPMKKTDKGVSPMDKSHSALRQAQQSKRFENQFNLREMRDAVQRGEPFPVILEPRHDWFDGASIADM
jgi:glycosyltransferase involved in cell wall biosynthesis